MMTRQCPINIVRPVKMIVCLLSAVRPSSSFYQQSIERQEKIKDRTNLEVGVSFKVMV